MNILSDALTAILGGGATGLLGSVVSVVVDLKKMKMEHQHKEEMEKLNQQGMKLEAEFKLQQTQVEGQVQTQLAETQAFAQSFGNDKATYWTEGAKGAVGLMLAVVDTVRGLVRPGLTVAAFWLMWDIYLDLRDKTENLGMDPQAAAQLLSDTVIVLLYMSTSMALWWFGTRTNLGKVGFNRK